MPKYFKDFNDSKVVIGDTVSFKRPRYAQIIEGKIIRITESMAEVEWEDDMGRKHSTRKYHGEFTLKPREIKISDFYQLSNGQVKVHNVDGWTFTDLSEARVVFDFIRAMGHDVKWINPK